MKVSRIGIFSQVLFQETIGIFNEILSVKGTSSISYYLNPELYDFILKSTPKLPEQVHRVTLEEMKVDCLITIGGDGTILRAARSRPDIPILSINKGRKGFMTEIESDEIQKNLKSFFNNKFKLEKHQRVEAFLNGVSIGSAINEIVITSVDLLKPIEFKVLIDDMVTSGTLADGLIISTALGSTGHALSSGGPIVDPALGIIELSWINPINLAIRPVILAHFRRIAVRCATRVNLIKIVIDGQVSQDFTTPIELEFFLSDKTVSFYRSQKFMKRWRQHIHPEIRD